MAGHSTSYGCFYCSDFATAIFEHGAAQAITERCPMDLKQQIHPIFARQRFQGVADHEYEKYFQEPLRFASRLFKVPSLCKYVVDTSEGELLLASASRRPRQRRRRVDLRQSFEEPDSDNYAEPKPLMVLPRKRQTKLSATRLRKKAYRFWLRMAGMVKFVVHDSGREGDKDLAGSCAPSQGALPRGTHPSILGCMSIININNYHLVDLQKATEIDARDLREAQFQLAITLIHELGHAMDFALFGDRFEEVFPGSAHLHEAGFALENALYGGCNLGHKYVCDPAPRAGPTLHDCLIMYDWPSDYMREVYARIGSCFAARPQDRHSFNVVRLVPRHYIARLFTEDFWQHHVKERPTAPLLTGYPMARWMIQGYQPDVVNVLMYNLSFWKKDSFFRRLSLGFTGTGFILDDEPRLGVAFVDHSDPEIPLWVRKDLAKFHTHCRKRTKRSEADLLSESLQPGPATPWEGSSAALAKDFFQDTGRTNVNRRFQRQAHSCSKVLWCIQSCIVVFLGLLVVRAYYWWPSTLLD